VVINALFRALLDGNKKPQWQINNGASTPTNLTNTGSLNINLNQYPIPCPDPSGSLIYSYIGGVATVYSASYFVGGSPTLTIDP
jgi:hypothetical protein